MTAPPTLRVEELTSYSRVHSRTMQVAEPADEAELALWLDWAATNGRRIVLRGGGQALHNHAVGPASDIALSFDKMPRPALTVDRTAQTLTVVAWHTWDEILAACLAQGYVPFVAVSSRYVTAGGSLSADGLSRATPLAGKESGAVQSLRVMLADGSIHSIGHPELPAGSFTPTSTLTPAEQEQLFRAIVAGYGLVGVLLSITYFVMELDGLPDAQTRWRARTRIETFRAGRDRSDGGVLRYMRGYDRVLRRMDMHMEELRSAMYPLPPGPPGFPAHLPPRADPAWEFPYAAMYFTALGGSDHLERGWEAASSYTKDSGPTFFAYDIDRMVGTLKLAIRLLPRWAYLTELVIRASMRFASIRPGYNPIDDFTFFFTAHTEAMRQLVAGGNLNQRALQQTFAIRSDVGVDGTPTNTGLMADFVRDARAIFREGYRHRGRRLRTWPNVADVLYIPAGDGFLSASHDLDGFAVTFGIEGLDTPHDFDNAKQTLSRITALCARPPYEGRVHLTKNVFADPKDVAAMYAWGLPLWTAAKQRFDPNGRLGSDFYDEVLKPAAAHLGLTLP